MQPLCGCHDPDPLVFLSPPSRLPADGAFPRRPSDRWAGPPSRHASPLLPLPPLLQRTSHSPISSRGVLSLRSRPPLLAGLQCVHFYWNMPQNPSQDNATQSYPCPLSPEACKHSTETSSRHTVRSTRDVGSDSSSFSRTLPHTHTHTLAQTHSPQTLTLTLSHTLTLTHVLTVPHSHFHSVTHTPHSHTPILTFTHTHCHTLTLRLSHSHTPFYTLPSSITLTHTCSHIHTLSHAPTHSPHSLTLVHSRLHTLRQSHTSHRVTHALRLSLVRTLAHTVPSPITHSHTHTLSLTQAHALAG